MSGLRRSISLPMLAAYGIGTTVGAGIYVLVGEVAAAAGAYAPLAFLVAAGLAGLSALSFAELSARFPLSAGEAIYVHEGFGRAWLATVTGLLVGLAGLVSAATIVSGFVGYLNQFVTVPHWLGVVGIVAVLAGIAAWGIRESVVIAAVLTGLEVGVLVLVVILGADDLGAFPQRWAEAPPLTAWVTWSGILAGAVLAFYAFIGFEDMVNVAEEVRDVRRAMPWAIAITLVVTGVLYLAISAMAVAVLPPEIFAGSEAPLTLIYIHVGGSLPDAVNGVALAAVINGALVQIVMASRVIYGLAGKGWLPAALGAVHARTRTPVRATAIAAVVVLVAAAALPLVSLAQIASVATMIIFALVNLALLAVKRHGPGPVGGWSVPVVVPALGCLASSALAAWQISGFLA